MENLGLGAGMAAMAFWGFVAVVVVAGIWDGIRKREAKHETLRRIIESGQTIDQELMDKLLSLSGGGTTRHDRDFQVAGLWILPIAVGLSIFGLILGSQDPATQTTLLGVSALLAAIGIGCLVASKIAARWYPADSDSEPNQLKE